MTNLLDMLGHNTGSIAVGLVCHKSVMGQGTILSCSRKKVLESNSTESKDAILCWLSRGCWGLFDRVGSCLSTVADGLGMPMQSWGCQTGEGSIGYAIVSSPLALGQPIRVFSGVSVMCVLFILSTCAWPQVSTVRDFVSEDEGSADLSTIML